MEALNIFKFKRSAGRRISVWVLVFALTVTLVTSFITLNARADNFLDDARDAASDIGEGMGDAASDLGEGMGDAVSDITDNMDKGTVSDSDGFIEDTDENGDQKSNGGWIALAIAIAVILAIVILIIVFIPKKKDN